MQERKHRQTIVILDTSKKRNFTHFYSSISDTNLLCPGASSNPHLYFVAFIHRLFIFLIYLLETVPSDHSIVPWSWTLSCFNTFSVSSYLTKEKKKEKTLVGPKVGGPFLFWENVFETTWAERYAFFFLSLFVLFLNREKERGSITFDFNFSKWIGWSPSPIQIDG